MLSNRNQNPPGARDHQILCYELIDVKNEALVTLRTIVDERQACRHCSWAAAELSMDTDRRLVPPIRVEQVKVVEHRGVTLCGVRQITHNDARGDENPTIMFPGWKHTVQIRLEVALNNCSKNKLLL